MKLKRFLSAVMAAAVFAAAVPAGASAEPETDADAATYEAAADIENIDTETEHSSVEHSSVEPAEIGAYENTAAEPIMADPEPIVQSADEVLHGEPEPKFETTEDGTPIAKTRVWNLGTYFVNGNEKAMEEYDAKYLVDKDRSATVKNNGQSYPGTQLQYCYDGDWKTHWETRNPNGNNRENNRIEFDFNGQPQEIGRIIFRARNSDGAPTKGYPYEFKIYYQGENDADYRVWAVGSSASATTDIIEITVPTRTVKKLKFEYITAKENWAAAAEFRFYRTEHAQDDYMGLFLDSSCAALAHGVTAARVIELEKNIDKYPAPLPNVLRAYVDAALSLLNVPGRGENVSAPITMSQRGNRGTEAARVQTTFHIGGQYDITGLYAMPDEKIGIFVSYDPDGPAPRIVFATANQYRGGWFKSWDGVTLSNGYNEIDCAGMQCCQLIYLYNPALPQDQAFPPVARIVGGTEYPVYHYNADNPDLSDDPEEFKKELAEYVEQVADLDDLSSRGEGKYNVCELVTKRIVLTTSARGALKGLESSAKWDKGYEKWQKGEATPDPNRTYQGAKDVMELWEQLMREDYAEYMGYNTTDPLGEDYEPRPAFLWRIHTDGVGWGWAQSVYASINAGNLKDDDPWTSGEFQSFTSPSSVLSAGWGTYHEIGHVYDNGAIGTSESTNNLYALNASLKYQGVSRMTNENRWFKHYVTAINTGVLPDGDLIFYPATVIFQLEMVDFDATALYPDIKSVYGKAARFSRLHSFELSGLPKDERLIVSLSMGNGVDLSDHFEVFGHKLSKEAKWLLKDLPKETRPLHYANERMLNGTAFTDEEKAIKPQFTATYVLDNEKGKSDKKGSIVKIDIKPDNYTEDGKIKANLLCFEVWKTDVTNGEKGDRQFVGITGDDLRTNENELFSLEDNNVAPGHKYKYYVKPYDCSLHTPDNAESESEEVDVPDSSYVAMTSLSINGKGTSGISVKPGEPVKVELGYFPQNTTYDFSCTNWELTTNNVRDVTLEEDPEYPGDPTHKILKTSANSRGTVSIKASAGGARGVQYMGYGRDADGNYQTGMAVQADMRVTISGKEVEMTGIKINQENIVMSKGQTSQLTTSILPEDATTNAAIRWSSDNESVATVDQDTGLVTAVGNGTAEISAYVMESAEGGDDDQKIEDTITVTVSDSGAKLEGIEIVSWADKEGATPILYSGAKNFQRMKIKPVPENAEYDPNDVEWSITQCKEVTEVAFGYTEEEKKYYEEQAKENPNLWVADFGYFHPEYKDELEGIGAISAVLEIQAKLEVDGQTFTDKMDVQVDYNQDPELPIAIRSLTLNDTEQTMEVNDTLDLSLTYAPVDAVGKDNVRWTTSDANVATVVRDETDITKAKVTAVAPGTAKITGNWSGKRAVCEVTVAGEIELTDVKFKVKNNDQPGDLTQELVEGGSYQLMLYPVPVDATNTEATVWTTSDESVADVNTKTGFVEAIAPGTADITGTITQKRNDGKEVSYQKKCTITVKKKEIALTGSAISENSKQLKPGETAELNISARPSNANMRIDEIEWDSSNDGVATVSASSKDNRTATITAVAEGECQITGTMGGFPVTCDVSVENEKKEVQLSLRDKDKKNVTDQDIELQGINDAIRLACYVDTYGYNLSKDEMYWNSSDESVVTVDDEGKITAVGEGTAVVSATATAHIGSAKCTVTVPNSRIADPVEPVAPPTQAPQPTFTPEPGRPTPSAKPTTAPATAAPSATPTTAPATAAPSATPTTAPATAAPSATPTAAPATAAPSATPTTAPATAAPSATPTTAPATATPSATPTAAPATAAPSATPTTAPATASPSTTPTTAPATASPSATPTTIPATASPSATPTTAPATAAPSATPTTAPATAAPSATPTAAPATAAPSATPTTAPATATPSATPTAAPATAAPTAVPEYEYTIDGIKVIGGNMVEVSVTENFGTGGTLIICSYNADGALTDIKTKPVRYNTTVSEVMNIADAKTITAFVWDNLGGLKPLALPKTTEIK